MKNSLFQISVIIVILIVTNCGALYSQSTFVHKITGNTNVYEIFWHVTGTRDGGYALYGGLEDTIFGAPAISITKIDSSGNILWNYYYAPNCQDGNSTRKFRETSDSGFYVSDFMDLSCITGVSWKIYKIDKNGNGVWTIKDEQLNDCSFVWLNDMEKDKNSDNFVVTGGTELNDVNCDFISRSGFINKYDSSGTLLFSMEFDDDFFWEKCEGFYDSGGNLTEYLIMGYSPLLKLSPTGTIIWMKSYLPFANYIDAAKIGTSYYLLGDKYYGSAQYSSALLKTDLNGNPIFSINIDSVKGFKIINADSNSLLIIGSLGAVTKYPVVIEMDTIGNITKALYSPSGKYLSSYYDENTKALLFLYRKNFYYEGFIEKMYLDSSCSFRDTVLNSYTVSLPTDSTVTFPFFYHQTSIDCVITATPHFDPIVPLCGAGVGIKNVQPASSYFQISPNPTTYFITIHYNLSSPSQITLSLFNLYGQKLKTILNEKQPAGEHEMKMEMKDLEQGVYFVKMSVGGKEEVKKIIKY